MFHPLRTDDADYEQEGAEYDEYHDVTDIPAHIDIFFDDLRISEKGEGHHEGKQKKYLQRAHKRDRHRFPDRYAVFIEQIYLKGAAAALHRGDGAAEVIYPDDGKCGSEGKFFAGGAGKRHEFERVKYPAKYDEASGAEQKPGVRVFQHHECRGVYTP